MLILSKKEMREKGLKSPDAADAAIYACVQVDESALDLSQPGDRMEIDLDQYTSEFGGFYESSYW